MTPEDQALYGRLVDALYAMDPLFRPYAHWIMDKSWLDRIKAMRIPGASGYDEPLWELPHRYLLGKRFQIRPDGGFPHLEVQPVGDPAAKPGVVA